MWTARWAEADMPMRYASVWEADGSLGLTRTRTP